MKEKSGMKDVIFDTTTAKPSEIKPKSHKT